MLESTGSDGDAAGQSKQRVNADRLGIAGAVHAKNLLHQPASPFEAWPDATKHGSREGFAPQPVFPGPQPVWIANPEQKAGCVTSASGPPNAVRESTGLYVRGAVPSHKQASADQCKALGAVPAAVSLPQPANPLEARTEADATHDHEGLGKDQAGSPQPVCPRPQPAWPVEPKEGPGCSALAGGLFSTSGAPMPEPAGPDATGEVIGTVQTQASIPRPVSSLATWPGRHSPTRFSQSPTRVDSMHSGR